MSEGKLVQPSVSEEKLVQLSVSEDKLVQPSVSEGKLVKPSVIEEKLVQPSVSEGKLVKPSIIEEKLVQPSVTGKRWLFPILCIGYFPAILKPSNGFFSSIWEFPELCLLGNIQNPNLDIHVLCDILNSHDGIMYANYGLLSTHIPVCLIHNTQTGY